MLRVYGEYRYYDKSKLGKPQNHGHDLKLKFFKTYTGPKNLVDAEGNLLCDEAELRRYQYGFTKQNYS